MASIASAAVRTERMDENTSRDWVRHLVPLPKQIELAGQVLVPADQIVVVAEGESHALVSQAVKELVEAIGAEHSSAAAEKFTVKLRVGGPLAERLTVLPHADQAYTIGREEDGNGLLLVGGGPRGVYYAAKTLQQFIRAGRKGDTIALPAANIVDWPDMEDRGLWGGDSYNHLRWMSDRKLNYDEQIAHNGVDANKRPVINLGGGKRKIIDEGPTYGINPVPVVLHLEQLSGSGLFDAYPELRGKDGRAGSICYSNPLFVNILAEWLLLWRAEPGVREVDVWMAENLQGEKGCQCDDCRREDRNVLEARAIVAAWRKARETQPDLGIRILTSEETEKSNPRIFSELPTEVKIWYYHSLWTYNASEKPMIRPYLAELAARGRWVGVCPNLCANVGTWHPFTCPQFVHYRINEFVDKKLSGFIGYAVPRLAHVRFNTEAAAEWLWNAKGRSPREFAISYAVREGYAEPKLFADWVEAHGPVAWDIYGSDFPAGHQRDFPGKLAILLREGKVPNLGEELWEVYPLPWGDIKTPEQLADDVARADRAVKIAEQMQIPQYLHESRVTQEYIKALEALWTLKALVRNGMVSASDKLKATEAFAAYAAGLEQARTALADWEPTVGPAEEGVPPWVNKPRKLLETMIEEMNALARDLGCMAGG